MALLHEILYRSGNLAHINFAVYVRDLLAHLLPSFGAISARVKVESNVAPVGLALEQALPCGLIINELVSNSLKHGFPEDHYGSVLITLQPGEDQQLVLSVRDDGVGMPVGFDFAGTPTLGLKLVSNLTGQLGGQLTVEDPHTDGAAFTVVFSIPLDAVL
jgi:two-component sensor histidine kinase